MTAEECWMKADNRCSDELSYSGNGFEADKQAIAIVAVYGQERYRAAIEAMREDIKQAMNELADNRTSLLASSRMVECNLHYMNELIGEIANKLLVQTKE